MKKEKWLISYSSDTSTEHIETEDEKFLNAYTSNITTEDILYVLRKRLHEDETLKKYLIECPYELTLEELNEQFSNIPGETKEEICENIITNNLNYNFMKNLEEKITK